MAFVVSDSTSIVVSLIIITNTTMRLATLYQDGLGQFGLVDGQWFVQVC